jgi:hypothetical protein
VVSCGGVLVDGGGRLGAEIAQFGIELRGGYGVCAAGARELHAAKDALDSIGFH